MFVCCPHWRRPWTAVSVSPVLEGVVGKTHVTPVDLTCFAASEISCSLRALSAVFLAFVKVCGSTCCILKEPPSLCSGYFLSLPLVLWKVLCVKVRLKVH